MVFDLISKKRLVGIVDDEVDITKLFRDAWALLMVLQFLHSQIQYWLLNILQSIKKGTC